MTRLNTGNQAAKDFDSQILNLAHACGYRAVHFRPALTKWGYRTALQGDSGLPDWILVGHGRVIFLEAKTGKGRLSPEQKDWFAWMKANKVEHREVRPENLQELSEWLMLDAVKPAKE